MAVNMKITLFWDMMPHSLADHYHHYGRMWCFYKQWVINQNFGETCCFFLQGRTVSHMGKQQLFSLLQFPASALIWVGSASNFWLMGFLIMLQVQMCMVKLMWGACVPSTGLTELFVTVSQVTSIYCFFLSPVLLYLYLFSFFFLRIFAVQIQIKKQNTQCEKSACSY
jgi:hypothetical protein